MRKNAITPGILAALGDPESGERTGSPRRDAQQPLRRAAPSGPACFDGPGHPQARQHCKSPMPLTPIAPARVSPLGRYGFYGVSLTP
ncbi:MAG: hypothetical protein ABWY06_14595 [Pseudomonas sp.]|uniref:hypothetical protein n=1 Tax=Pseudomonas sp. TaxID=306 RepID=UPI003398291A